MSQDISSSPLGDLDLPNEENQSDNISAFNDESGSIEANNQASEIKNMETHADHLHKAPGHGWKHYVFEFFMLFLAVFCGFLAENLRESSIEKKHEREFVLSFIEDLKVDTATFNNIIRRGAEKADGLDSLAYNCFYYNNADSVNRLIYRLYRSYASNSFSLIIEDRTFAQLKNSGNMRLIRSKIALNEMLEYYQQCDALKHQCNEVYEGIFGRAFQLAWTIFNGKFTGFNPATHKRMTLDSSKNYLLMTIDPQVLNNYGNNLTSIAGIARSLVRGSVNMRDYATNLIVLIKKEYDIQ